MNDSYWRFRMASAPVTQPLCDTPGCSRFAAPGRGFCLKCEDQLWELDRIAFRRDGRRPRGPRVVRMSPPRILFHRVRRNLWIANLIFICGVLIYFGCACLDAVISWLAAGGLQ